MKNPSIKRNFILSTAYQILTMITPLLTAPYISRVLGPSGVGTYSYTYSIETYFSMFAALGTVSYGAREIARNREDKKTYSKLFWEIELLTVATSLACLLLWGVWIFVNEEYRIYYAILTFYLFATMFDISWFYTGLERFEFTVTQNTVFKLLGIAALFIFVKDKGDVAIYTAIMSLSMLLGNMSMWIYLPKFIQKVNLKDIHIVHHFKETLIYFIPTIATSIYTVLDKTLIGLITKDVNQNGYYEQATKIINMAKAVTFTGLNTVLGARISYLFAENQIEEIKEKIHFSFDYIMFMGIAICFGLIGVAHRFVPWFFGDGYEEVRTLLYLLSPVIIIVGISNCLGSQYYTPAGYRKQSAFYLIVGSCVNLVLNICLIPIFNGRGAVVSTIIGESVISILYLKNCRGFASFLEVLKISVKKLLAAIVMFIVIRILDGFFTSNFIALVCEVAMGGLTYILVLILLRDPFIKTMLKRFVK